MTVTCRNYTKARRHPKVIGRLPGGKPLPVPITMPQLFALAVSACLVALLFLFTPLGGLPPIVAVIVGATIIVVPFVAVRAWRPDQRAPHAQFRALTLDRFADWTESRR